MGQILAAVAVLGVFAAFLYGMVRLGNWARRRGVGGEVMGPFEEIWHPAAREFRFEIRIQDERKVPLPSADDRLKHAARRARRSRRQG